MQNQLKTIKDNMSFGLSGGCWLAGACPMLRSIPLIPEDWVLATEFGGGTGSLLSDLTKTEFLPSGTLDSIQIGPMATGEDKTEIWQERQSTERLMTFYCILVECQTTW